MISGPKKLEIFLGMRTKIVTKRYPMLIWVMKLWGIRSLILARGKWGINLVLLKCRILRLHHLADTSLLERQQVKFSKPIKTLELEQLENNLTKHNKT